LAHVGTRQIADDDPRSILRKTLCGCRTDGTRAPADERNLALQRILYLAHPNLRYPGAARAALKSGFLTNDIAQRSDAFDRRLNDIAGRQKAASPVAGAGRGSCKQHIATLEA